MLVLTRKAGEQFVIGGNICVTVVAVRGKRVRIGIDAPGEIHIAREELYEPPARPNDRCKHELKEIHHAAANQ